VEESYRALMSASRHSGSDDYVRFLELLREKLDKQVETQEATGQRCGQSIEFDQRKRVPLPVGYCNVLRELQEEAERQMRDSDAVGDKEWSASYHGQAYAFRLAIQLAQQKGEEIETPTLVSWAFCKWRKAKRP
jgi:hypothetical protein